MLGRNAVQIDLARVFAVPVILNRQRESFAVEINPYFDSIMDYPVPKFLDTKERVNRCGRRLLSGTLRNKGEALSNKFLSFGCPISALLLSRSGVKLIRGTVKRDRRAEVKNQLFGLGCLHRQMPDGFNERRPENINRWQSKFFLRFHVRWSFLGVGID